MQKIRLLNIDILSVNKLDLLRDLNFGLVIPVNVDMIVKMQKDREFYNTVKNADWVICDSNILNLGARITGKSFKEVLPGSSFFPSFYQFHKDNEAIKIFLLGAAEGVALTAQQEINKKVGRNIVVGAHSPSFGFEKNEVECQNIIEIIKCSGASVLAVGVGAPKQEKWLMKFKDQLPDIKIFFALGATIDFEAGNIKRAPKYIQTLHLEWLFRLIKEPKRLWKRYLVDDMPFFIYLLRQKLGIYKNPMESN